MLLLCFVNMFNFLCAYCFSYSANRLASYLDLLVLIFMNVFGNLLSITC